MKSFVAVFVICTWGWVFSSSSHVFGQSNGEKTRLLANIALQKEKLETLVKREETLPSQIEKRTEGLKLLRIYLSEETETYYQKHDYEPEELNVIVEMFDNLIPKTKYSLYYYDFIEEWIPKLEKHLIEKHKAGEDVDLEYTDDDVIEFGLARLEEKVAEMKEELEALPDKIRKQKKSLVDAELELVKLNIADEADKTAALEQEDGLLRANGTGELYGKTLKPDHITGCGNGDPEFSLKFPLTSMVTGLGQHNFDFMGVTMDCPNLLDGLIIDFQEACNKFTGAKPPMTARLLPNGVPVCWPNNRKWGPPKPGEASWGINSTPLSGVCMEGYYTRPPSPDEVRRIVPLLKFSVRTLKVECFFIERTVLTKLLEESG